MTETELPFEQWWNTHDLIASLVPSGSRVLDVGCGWGAVAMRLRDRSSSITGVEPDPSRIEIASQWCDQVVCGVAEGLDEAGLAVGDFDVLVFADVLEHLVDPWTVLKDSLRFVAPGGQVIISIPNVANYAARLNFLKGQFNYEDSGLYDRTHLRYFTRATLEEMIGGAGLRAVEWRYTPNLTRTRVYSRTIGRLPFLRRTSEKLDRWLTYRYPRLFAVQFVVRCERSSA